MEIRNLTPRLAFGEWQFADQDLPKQLFEKVWKRDVWQRGKAVFEMATFC